MAALWSLIAVAILACIAVVGNADLGPGFALVAILGWVVLLPITWPVNGQRRLSDVAFLAGCVFFLTFGLRSMLLLLRSQPELMPALPDPTVLAALAGFHPIHFEALLLATVCWVAFTVGYRAPLGAVVASRIGDARLEALGTGRLAFAVCVLAGCGWAARLAFRAAFPVLENVDPAAYGVGDTLLTYLSVLAPTALVLALLGVVRFPRHPVFIALAASLTVAEIGFALLVGVRTPLFSVALALVAFGVVRSARPGRWLLVLVPVAIVILGATAVYRIPQFFSESRADDPIQRVATTIDRSLELGPVGLAEVGLWNVSARYIGVDSVAQVLLVGPPEPTWGERYLLAVPSALIPRFLWPDKPGTEIAIEFGQDYLAVPSSVTVFVAPTWVGDLLLSFPLLVVPLAMLLLGVTCRVLNDYGWRAQARRSFGMVPYALLLPVAVQADAWISGGIYQATQALAICIVLALFLTRGRLPRQASVSTTMEQGGTRPAAAFVGVEPGPSPGGAA